MVVSGVPILWLPSSKPKFETKAVRPSGVDSISCGLAPTSITVWRAELALLNSTTFTGAFLNDEHGLGVSGAESRVAMSRHGTHVPF
jgi:hypothetical protein